MVKCPNCGAELDEGTAYCPFCGVAVIDLEEDEDEEDFMMFEEEF